MRTKTRNALLAVVIGAGIATGIIYVQKPGNNTTPPPQPGFANLFIGANGSCARSNQPVVYNPATSCGGSQYLQQAYTAAQNGDTVGIEAGTYSTSQQINYSASKNPNGPAVTYIPDGGHVKFTGASFDLGSHFCNTLPPGGGPKTDTPDWISFNGGANRDIEWGDRTHEVHFQLCPRSTHITLDSVKVGIEMPLTGPALEIESPDHFVLNNSIIGPMCCGNTSGTTGPNASGQATPWPLRLSLRPPFNGNNYPNPTDSSITNNDFEGAQRFCSDWDTAAHGACPSFDATNLNAVHGDCIHAFGGVNMLYSRNLFHRCDVQGLFLEDGPHTGVPGAVQVSAIVENNMFSDFQESNKCGFCVGTGGTVSMVARNNSFDTTASMRFGIGDPNDSGDITVTGNIVPDMGSNGGQLGSCFPSIGTMNFHYSYNVWNSNNPQGVPINCGSPTTAVANYDALFTDSTPGSGNGILDLALGSSAPNNFMTSGCPAVDFHGSSRTTPCDSGADEFGVIHTGASLGTCATNPCTAGTAPGGGSAGSNPGCTAGPVTGATNEVGVGNINWGSVSYCGMYGYYKPGNLVINDSTHPPAAVLVAAGSNGTCSINDPYDSYRGSNWNTVANTAKIMVIYVAKPYDPNAAGGPGCIGSWGQFHRNVDLPDPGSNVPNADAYFAAVVSDIENRFNVDPQRIYFQGASSGGAIVDSIACSVADSPLFRGFSPVSNFKQLAISGGNPVPGTERCPSTNKNYFYMNVQGNNDGNVPYNGVCVASHCVLGWDTNADWWASHLSCATGPTTTMFGSPSAANTKRSWSNCAFGLTPAMGGGILVANGCHAWTGLDAIVNPLAGGVPAGSSCAGGGFTNNTNGFDSAQYVWDFWANSQW